MDDVTKYGPVDGDPIIEKEEIPFDKNVNLIRSSTWYRKVVQKGENGEKQLQHQLRKIH